MVDLQQLWDQKWDEQVEKRKQESPSYDVGDYSVTGKAAAKYGGKRTPSYWAETGPALLELYIAWRKRTNWTVWHTDDGTPGIELSLRFEIPGLDLPIVGYIDRVFVTPVGELAVVDIKSGRVPDYADQLGLYALGMEIQYGIRPTWGYFYDAHKGEHGQPLHLDKYDAEYFRKRYAMTAAGVNAGVFLPQPGMGCANWCGVADYCSAVGGQKAAGVDPLA